MRTRLTSNGGRALEEEEAQPMMEEERRQFLAPSDAAHRRRSNDTDDDLPDIPQRWPQKGNRSRKVMWYALFLLSCISLFAVSEILLSRFFMDPLHSSPSQPAAATTSITTTTPAQQTQTPEAKPKPKPEVGISLKQFSDELDLKTGFTKSSKPTTRNYTFNITLGPGSPDGFSKSVIFINGQSPGPLIEANTGDTLRVVVNNLLPEVSTSIHWHGIDQRNSSWMDGVPGVTQCGIPPGESFTYEFTLTGQRGTFWYHSHVSAQYAEGLYGPLIIHDVDEKIPAVDDDKIIMFGDLFHQDTQELVTEYLGTTHPWAMMAGMEPPPSNIIINGHHVSNCSAFPSWRSPLTTSKLVTSAARNCTLGTLSTTTVKPNQAIRLRLISHSASTPFWFSIDNHRLSLVEMDGNEIQPIATTRVFMNPGQRYSVIIKTNQTSGNYLVRATAVLDCFHLPGGAASEFAQIDYQGVAVLAYHGAKPEDGTVGKAWDLNAPNTGVVGAGQEPWRDECADLPFGLVKMVRGEKAYEVGEGEGNRHYISFERFMLDGRIKSKMNQTIYQPLPNDATLWRALELDGPLKSLKQGDLGADQMVLVSQDSEKGTQIVVNSLAMMMHPFHLHGQNFQIIGWGEDKFGEGTTTWNLENPTRRDTLTIPGFSHVVLRIKGENPGIWAFHCHILWHAEDGMFFSIGQRLRELVKSLEGPATQGLRRRFCSVGR